MTLRWALLLGGLIWAAACDGDDPPALRARLEIDVPGGGGHVYADPGGLDCDAPCGASYTPGTRVLLTARADLGMAFAAWGDACAGDAPYCEAAVTGTTRVSARFRRYVDETTTVTRALTITTPGPAPGWIYSDDGAVDCAPDCAATYGDGDRVVLHAVAGLNARLTAWGGDCATAAGGDCALTMDADREAVVTFDWIPCAADDDHDPSNGCYAAPPTYAVEVTVGGTGAVVTDVGGFACNTACTFTLPGGGVQFTAVPATTSVFAFWGGACAAVTAPTCLLDIAAPVTVNATFTP